MSLSCRAAYKNPGSLLKMEINLLRKISFYLLNFFNLTKPGFIFVP